MTPPLLIRTARHRAGMTQAALADVLGVMVGTITRWELGTRSPSAADLERALKACGFSIELKEVKGCE